MRWSLIFHLFPVFAALLALDGTFALPAPRDGALALNARAGTGSGLGVELPNPSPKPVPTRTLVKRVAKSTQAVKAGDLKKASKTYRNAAMKSPKMYDVVKGVLKKTNTPAKMVSGSNYHADHILEAQTAAKAISGAGHTPGSLGKKKWTLIKNVLNDPKNMAMLAGDVNTAKGRICKAGLNNCPPNPADVKLSQAYMKDTKSRGQDAAAEIDKIIGGNAVQTMHKDILAKAGVKREIISEWEDLE
ncbi:hypothetical protein BDQ12DRAFT_760010 [Crucibulum laeve]|uniref:Uncharacterized protein n=1 Tax=Crucibulum laeve TaxID=68775 RepID=A0A5C3LTN8_9AGAR|nr:hypothetical protein BDQ12DRAFT_760010 [Crucibulum laeve]